MSDEELEPWAEVEPGDTVTINLGTDAAGCEVTGLVMAVSYTSELDTDTVLVDGEGVGYGLVHRTEIRIAGMDGWIDITEVPIMKEGEDEATR